jgi:hypothetical protein
MTSTYNDIRAAIEGRIAAELAKAPAYPVSYQNIPFTPPNNSPWLQVFLRLGDNAYATLKSFNRQNGVLVVNVFTLRSKGAALNFSIAERIKDLFDRQTVSGIIFDAASGPAPVEASVIESGVSAGSGLASIYYQTQLTITFEAYVD